MRLRRNIRMGTSLVVAGLAFSWTASTLEAQLAPLAVSAAPSAGQGAELASRVATYQDAAGRGYFAASVQPPADEAVLQLIGDQPARVAVVIDTSASQSGAHRVDQLMALRGVLAGLRPSDTVQLFAADVSTIALGNAVRLDDSQALEAATDQLQSRVPLGTTNLASALHAVRTTLLGDASEGLTRSVIYIGDGGSLELAGDLQRLTTLVDALRADHIAVHSVAVGATKNIALLGSLANQTGGELAVIAEERPETALLLGKQLAVASRQSPLWVRSLSLPSGLQTIQSHRLPPLRIDRDTLFFGTIGEAVSGSETATGPIRIEAETARGVVRFETDADIEASHHDFAFLPTLVTQAQANGAVMLPTAGSGWLRVLVQSMSDESAELTVAAGMALVTGSPRGAEAIAEMAIAADPNNTVAQKLYERATSGNRLILQNDTDGLFDLFAEAQAAEAAGADAAADHGTGVAPTTPAPPRPGAGFSRDGRDPLEPGSGLIDRVVSDRAAEAGRLRASVRAQLMEARRELDSNPIGVSNKLKLLLNQVQSYPDLPGDVRQELLGQVRSAIQSASRREAAAVEAEASAMQVAAAATQSELLLQQAFRREDQLAGLSNQLNALVAEGRIRFADREVIPAIEELAKDSVFSNQALLNTQMANSATRMRNLRLLRERNFLDAIALVEEANVPFVDDQPVKYPDDEFWARMSRHRIEKYGSQDLLGTTEAETRIRHALAEEVSFEFVEETLENALRIIGEQLEINVRLDVAALDADTSVTPDDTVNVSLSNVPLRSFLREMLDPFEDLTYEIENSTLKITSRDKADANLKMRIYAVGDLGIPPGAGMMGGMGGGMMGGMGGGMMGGMGGGMMGGMGGGMGGMMGGMGGGMGMMMVPSESNLSAKRAATAPTTSLKPAPTTATSAANAAEDRNDRIYRRIQIDGVSGYPTQADWLRYFDQLEPSEGEEAAIHDQRVLSTVSYFNSRVKQAEKGKDKAAAQAAFVAMRDLLSAAMLSNQLQPWMFQAYAVALQGSGAELAEIERAYLSAVEFARSPEELLSVADRLRRLGCEPSALRICRSVTESLPYHRQAYAMGLQLAKDLDDLDAMQWACRGVLSQAWPRGSEQIEKDARLLARNVHQILVNQGKRDQANAFLADIQQATAHDLVVRVSWTGDADIDIAVEEPSGTVSAAATPFTAGGGTFLGDGYPGLAAAEEQGVLSETYLCPQGFSGTYRILVRRVWGEVTSGKVTVDIISDIGRESQRYIRQQIDLSDKDALVLVDVKEGSRQAAVGEAQLAHLRDLQHGKQPKYLGQLMEDVDAHQQYLEDIAVMRSLMRGRGGLGYPGFAGRGAVGYRPEITVIPEGAMLSGVAVISADRRYVRASMMPYFSQIGEVSTFNFVDPEGEGLDIDGDTGGGGGLGGGGLGGGGFGGGGFGGGGFGGGGFN